MKMQVKKYSKLKMFGLYALSLLVNLLPLIIVLIVNWEVCTKTKREGVAISVTGFVWVFFLVITNICSLQIYVILCCKTNFCHKKECKTG